MHLFEERRKPAQTTSSCLLSTHFFLLDRLHQLILATRWSNHQMAAAAAAARTIVPIRPSQAFEEEGKERPSGIFVRASQIDHSSPPARHLAGPQSWGTKGGPDTVGHDWTPMLKRANSMDHGAKQTFLSPVADLPYRRASIPLLVWSLVCGGKKEIGHRTLPCRAPGSLHALSMPCITIPVTGVSPGPLQRLCLKRCPSKSACEAPRRGRGRDALGNRKEAYLGPCLEVELHRRLYTSRVGTRGPAPSSKTGLYGLDLVSLQELCSAVAEHVKPIGPKAEGVLHFWTRPSALRWHVVTAIRNFPSSG